MISVCYLFTLLTATYCHAGEFIIDNNKKIKGDFKNAAITLQSSFGTLEIPTENIAEINDDSLTLLDGTIVKGTITDEPLSLIDTDEKYTDISPKTLKTYKTFLMRPKKNTDTVNANWQDDYTNFFKDKDTANRQAIEGRINRTDNTDKLFCTPASIADLNIDLKNFLNTIGYADNDKITIEGSSKTTSVYVKDIKINKLPRNHWNKIINIAGKNSKLGKRLLNIINNISDTTQVMAKLTCDLYYNGTITLLSPISNMNENMKSTLKLKNNNQIGRIVFDLNTGNILEKGILGE